MLKTDHNKHWKNKNMKENYLDAICMLENLDHDASSLAVNCNPKQNTGEEQKGRENRQR